MTAQKFVEMLLERKFKMSGVASEGKGFVVSYCKGEMCVEVGRLQTRILVHGEEVLSTQTNDVLQGGNVAFYSYLFDEDKPKRDSANDIDWVSEFVTRSSELGFLAETVLLALYYSREIPTMPIKDVVAYALEEWDK